MVTSGTMDSWLVSLLPIVLIFCALSILTLKIIALVDILPNNFKQKNDKLIWTLVVLFSGLIGPILYFLLGRKQKIART
ncbi:Phospholipase_D-nuclease N-terminal [Pustulibacterium marinum]|uniref:Phospholipase_D-nuclease N-terminal n=2 Tax=Pustulibacterium marinum TaxID=1224947 RepID=A0A1I7FV89_9FLAO|nr:Phospholipase_D-nuclease N-terminal [Pustulibacterium marinum]